MLRCDDLKTWNLLGVCTISIQDGGDDYGADMVMIIMTMVVMMVKVIMVLIVKLCHKLIMIIRKTFANEQICAGGEAGKDGCQGDSGGPFVHDR